jgi:hypothetical protein
MSNTGINNTPASETFENFGTAWKAIYRQQEGIIEGMVVTKTSPETTGVAMTAGSISINLGGNKYSTYTFEAISSLSITDTANNTYSLIALKVDVTNGTSTLVALSGTSGASTDPDLTEGSSPDLRYVPIARVVGTGSNVVNADITQDGVTLTNNASPEVIGYRHDAGWKPFTETMTYSSVNDPISVVTVDGDMSQALPVGTKLRLENATNTIYGIVHDCSVTNNVSTITILQEMALSSGRSTNAAVDILQNSAITNVYYAPRKSHPSDFPSSEISFSFELTDNTNQAQATPTQNVWYNVATNTLPKELGEWISKVKLTGDVSDTGTQASIFVTVSTANNTAGDALQTIYDRIRVDANAGNLIALQCDLSIEEPMTNTTTGTWYLNFMTNLTGIATVGYVGANGNDLLWRITSAYI